ncbi:hypothetical protein P154DRAFT_580225 [Amniculicola lignicola CBS 123094]|uniref:Uncharacterized protein n=1 Tax=Amniculicola lignicola CBS 123094 TaxID=1392246 RepID=A0A6A5W2N2_9PLEO|nr:hypothetical protein P154DRAFT_580225 [Amniculicola lignicola CBS 123094]
MRNFLTDAPSQDVIPRHPSDNPPRGLQMNCILSPHCTSPSRTPPISRPSTSSSSPSDPPLYALSAKSLSQNIASRNAYVVDKSNIKTPPSSHENTIKPAKTVKRIFEHNASNLVIGRPRGDTFPELGRPQEHAVGRSTLVF